MQFITKRIATGNSATPRDVDMLQAAGISAMLNVAIDLETDPQDYFLVNVKEGLIPGPGNSIEMLDNAVKTAIQLLRFHEKILIYGHVGKTRAALVAAAVWSQLGKAAEEMAQPHSISALSCLEKIRKQGNLEFLDKIVENELTNLLKTWEKAKEESAFRVSIIMPCYENEENTRGSLESIRKHTRYLPYELIGLNNGDAENTVLTEILEDACDEVIISEKRLGTAAAWNFGMEHSTGEIICLIGKNVHMQPNWLLNLCETLMYPKVNIVSPIFSYHLDYFYRKMQNTTIPPGYPQWSIPVSFASSLCMIFKQELINDIAEFDESLTIGFNEDFCFRTPENVVIDLRAVLSYPGTCYEGTGDLKIDFKDTTKDLESLNILLNRWHYKHPGYDDLLKEGNK